MYPEELEFNIFLLLFFLSMIHTFVYGMKNDIKASVLIWMYIVVGLSSALVSRLITVVML